MKNIFARLFFIMLLVSCGRFANEDKHDDVDVRIVSAAKQYTEIMCALGADSNLVAVDLSSTYPPKVKALPTIGYHMNLSLEGIASVKPTLFLHTGGSYSIGPESVVSQLEKLQIPMKIFESKAEDIPSTKALIREMGSYFHKEEKAEALCETLDADMQVALESRKKYTDTVSVIVIHFGRASNVYLVRGNEDVAGKMINWAGGRIPIENKGMARITSPELIAKANPDVILLTDFGYDRLGSKEKIMELPGVALTNAAKTGRIFRVEGHDLIYLGPRTGENILKLQKLIHNAE